MWTGQRSCWHCQGSVRCWTLPLAWPCSVGLACEWDWRKGPPAASSLTMLAGQTTLESVLTGECHHCCCGGARKQLLALCANCFGRCMVRKYATSQQISGLVATDRTSPV